MNKSSKIHIIGAGVSGLAAAITLNKAGYYPVILDANAAVGGRVTTSHKDHLILDHGFQVLLDAYPAVSEFLDTKALQLIKFQPGSMVFIDGKPHKIGDPTRDNSFLWPTIVSGVGSLRDKWLVFMLSRKLKEKSLPAIFESSEATTLEYLKEYGFSHKMIHSFFKPFYTGIFLESELQTSSRMFEFVFKMFAEGSATLPKAGIGAIPKQMAAQLNADQLRLNTAVKHVQGTNITLENGEEIHSDYTIIATTAGDLVPNLPKDTAPWRSVTNLYFETDHAGYDQPIIGLISSDETLANNFHFLQDVFPDHRNIVSVSVVRDHSLSLEKLVERVRKELRDEAQIKAGEMIQVFTIKKALPQLQSLNYSMPATETQLTENVFLAGDQLSNGSLNAAMLNGKAAAQAVISKLNDQVII
jgi:phytoene dehydrogenase-like protein